MKKTFSEAFIDHIEKTGTAVAEIARKSGVKKDALYALKRGTTRNMAVDDAIKVAGAFGKTVEEFMELPPNQVRNLLAEQVARLSPREQAILEASLAVILSQRDSSDSTDSQGANSTKEPAAPKDD